MKSSISIPSRKRGSKRSRNEILIDTLRVLTLKTDAIGRKLDDRLGSAKIMSMANVSTKSMKEILVYLFEHELISKYDNEKYSLTGKGLEVVRLEDKKLKLMYGD